MAPVSSRSMTLRCWLPKRSISSRMPRIRRSTSGLSTLLLSRSVSKSCICGRNAFGLAGQRARDLALVELGPLGMVDVLLAKLPDFAELNLQRRGLRAGFLLHLEHAAQFAEDQRLPLGDAVFELLRRDDVDSPGRALRRLAADNHRPRRRTTSACRPSTRAAPAPSACSTIRLSRLADRTGAHAGRQGRHVVGAFEQRTAKSSTSERSERL